MGRHLTLVSLSENHSIVSHFSHLLNVSLRLAQLIAQFVDLLFELAKATLVVIQAVFQSRIVLCRTWTSPCRPVSASAMPISLAHCSFCFVVRVFLVVLPALGAKKKKVQRRAYMAH